MSSIKWAVDADGDWATAANWSGGALPGAADAVVLASTHAHTVTHATGTDTIDTLLTSTDTLDLAGGTLAVTAGGVFNQALIVSGGSLVLSGATNTAAAAVTFNQDDVQLAEGATLTTEAAFAVGNTSYFIAVATTLEGRGTLVTKGATTIVSGSFPVLTLGGGITWSNTGTVMDQGDIGIGTTLGATATISNAKGAVFDMVGGGIMNLSVQAGGVSAVGSAAFTNAGLLEWTGESYQSEVDAFLNNTGTLSLRSGGTLILYGGGSLGGTITGGGALAFYEGTYALNAVKLLDKTSVALFGGTATIAAGVSIGYLAVAGGAVDGAGTLANNGTTSLTNQVFLIGGGLTWRNNGVIILASGTLGSDTTTTGQDTLLNTTHATVELSGTASIQAYDGPSVAVTNSGLLETIASNTSLVTNAEITGAVTSTGTISVGSGTLTLTGGGTLAGKITGAGTLVLGGGAFSLAGASIASSTHLVLSGGTIGIAAGKILSNLIFTGGQIDGPGTLATSGAVTINAPAYQYETALTLGGGLTWSNSRTVTVLGTITAGDTAGHTASFVNSAAGTFDFAADVGINAYGAGFGEPYGSSTFTNAGLLEKTSGIGTTAIDSVLDNTGTIDVAAGTIDLTNGGTIGGTLAGGGTVLLGAGLFELDSPSILNGTQLVLAGGTVAIGAGQELTSLVFTGGEIDGPGTLATSGTVTIGASTYYYDTALTLGGGLTWNNIGDVSVRGTIEVGDTAGASANIVNITGGTFNIAASILPSGQFYSPGIGSYVGDITFINAGLLEATSSGFATIASALTSTGTIKVTSGVLSLTGGGTIGGTIAGGGTVELGDATGSHDIGGTFTLNGPDITDGTALVLAGDTVAVAADTTLSYLGLQRGKIDGPGTFSTASTTTATYVTLGGGLVWHNSGTAVIASLTLGDAVPGGASIINTATGVLTVGAASSTTAAGTVTNAGQLIFDSSAEGSSYYGVYGQSSVGAVLKSTGTLTVKSGQLGLYNGGAISGALNGTGTLYLERGQFALGGLTEAASTNLVIDSATAGLAAGASATLNGTLDENYGFLRLAAGSVLTAAGTASFGITPSSADQIDGPGTLLTSGSSFVADSDYTDSTTLLLGGKLTWRNSGTVLDAGFIRVGDGFGLTAKIINTATGVFDITTDDGGLGNNQVLSPLGITKVGSSTFANSGLLEKTGGTGTSFVTSAVTNTGTIEANSGDLALTSAIAGTGTLQIDAGATLETNGFAPTQSLVFNGAGGTLVLDTAQSVTTPITGLAAGDSFDLSFLPSVSGSIAFISGNTVSITPGGGNALTFLSADSLAGDSVTTGDDGNGGTLITLTAAADAARGTAAHLNGTTIAGFGPSAPIDLTDVAFTSLHALGFAGHVLTVSDGAHTAHLTLPGITSLAELGKASELHGGTLITAKV